WVIDPQDERARLLTNMDVAPRELDCLTSEGWVSVTELAELGSALHYDNRDGGEEVQVFVRQSERVLWRLGHSPTENEILEGRSSSAGRPCWASSKSTRLNTPRSR